MTPLIRRFPRQSASARRTRPGALISPGWVIGQPWRVGGPGRRRRAPPRPPPTWPAVPTRYDVERALEACGLKPPSRLIILVLCTYMDQGSISIPPEFSPSLTKISAISGLDRRQLRRHLDRLEMAGWLKRDRPDKHAARTRHVTTKYTVTPPGFPQDPGLGAPSSQAGGAGPPALGAPDSQAGGAGPRKSDLHRPGTDQTGDSEERSELKIVAEAVRARTDRHISDAHAARVRDQLLDGRGDIRNRRAWLLRVIATDRDPRRFLPTPTPPPYRPGGAEST